MSNLLTPIEIIEIRERWRIVGGRGREEPTLLSSPQEVKAPFDVHRLLSHIDSQSAETERLRSALERIAEPIQAKIIDAQPGHPYDATDYKNILYDRTTIAREALSETPSPERP